MVRNILPFDQCHPMLELKRKRAHRCATVFLMLNLTCNGIANLQYLIYSLWLIVKHIRLLVFMLSWKRPAPNIWREMRALWYGISSRYIIAVQKFEDFISSWVWGLTLYCYKLWKGCMLHRVHYYKWEWYTTWRIKFQNYITVFVDIISIKNSRNPWSDKIRLSLQSNFQYLASLPK